MAAIAGLSLQDASCPICLCILVQPVTLPCSHTLCLPCLRLSMQHTSLCCPLCRRRLSVWLRRGARRSRSETVDQSAAYSALVNQPLWHHLQHAFPDIVQRRLAGIDDEVIDADSQSARRDGVLCAPGAVGAEFAAWLTADSQEHRRRQRRQTAASCHLIRQLLGALPPDSSPSASDTAAPPAVLQSRDLDTADRKRCHSASPPSACPDAKRCKQDAAAAEDTAVSCDADGDAPDSFDSELLAQQLQIERQLQQEREDRLLAEQLQQQLDQSSDSSRAVAPSRYSLRNRPAHSHVR